MCLLSNTEYTGECLKNGSRRSFGNVALTQSEASSRVSTDEWKREAPWEAFYLMQSQL